jgi:hypothetical protein
MRRLVLEHCVERRGLAALALLHLLDPRAGGFVKQTSTTRPLTQINTQSPRPESKDVIGVVISMSVPEASA